MLGLGAAAPEIQSATEHDLGLMDGIALPFALLVLAFVLRSFRFLLVPVLCVVVAGITSFGTVYFVAKLMIVASFVPSMVLMQCTLALQIKCQLRFFAFHIDDVSHDCAWH